MLPRRYLPSISSLLALEALDRLGTATAAAAELALTQGAISRRECSSRRRAVSEFRYSPAERCAMTRAPCWRKVWSP